MKNLEKEGELTKDDISDSEKDIQDITTKFIDQVDSSLASKEKDLLTIYRLASYSCHRHGWKQKMGKKITYLLLRP